MSDAPETKASTSRGFDAKTKYVLGLIAASVVGFLIFRLFISDDKSPSPLTTPYSSEIAAAFAGTLLTVIVTALLLEQTKRDQAELLDKQALQQADLADKQEESQRKAEESQNEFQKQLLALTDESQQRLARLQAEQQAALQKRAEDSQADLNEKQARLQSDLQEKADLAQVALANKQAELQAKLQADLLAEQTKKETEKEKDVKIYETKLAIYGSLMEAIEAGLCQIGESGAAKADTSEGSDGEEELSHQIIRMNFQSYRTAFIADNAVQAALNNFAAKYGEVIADKKLTRTEWEELKKPLQTLILAMKADLAHHVDDASPVSNQPTAVGTPPTSSVTSSPTTAENMFADFAPPRMNRERFLSQCESEERDYFVHLLDYCAANPSKIVVEWNPKGFSVKDKNRKQFLWVFPKEGANSKGNINARTQHFPAKKAQIDEILRANNVSKLNWRPGNGPDQLSFEETKQIIDLVCEI